MGAKKTSDLKTILHISLRIALVDLNHMTRGVHTNTAPLGLGMIAKYLRLTESHAFDIRIIKDPTKAIELFEDWIPDVLGLAQYSWNSELNLCIARLVKGTNPNCLIVAGGPDLELNSAKRFAYLKNHAEIDICIAYDGEIPFAGIIKRMLMGETLAELKKRPVDGTYSLEAGTGELIESQVKPPRLDSLDEVAPLYATGILSNLLDEGFHPFVQTHRGCPFTCNFCHTSDDYYSHMLFMAPDIFREEMEYLGKRFAGKHNVTLYIANTNMSLFKEDFEIAQIIQDSQKKYDWPRLINVNSGKDPGRLLKMLSVINFQPAIALQTLTTAVLKNIRRKNIPFEKFLAFQHEVAKSTGEASATELILSLPGETKESFLETLRIVMNSGIQNIVIYTLMNLKGTPLASDETAEKYGHVIRHRVVPRQFSEINGSKIFDTEEVVVATHDMPYNEYLQLRGLSFTITAFFSSIELAPLKRLLGEYEIEIAEWIFKIHKKLPQISELNGLYEKFLKETEAELFVSREDLIKFYSDKRNYAALCSGELGDNLLRKNKYEILFNHFEAFTRLALGVGLQLLMKDNKSSLSKQMIDDLLAYLSMRNMKPILVNSNLTSERIVTLKYDIPAWLDHESDNLTLADFKGSFKYRVELSVYARKRLDDLAKLNKDLELSMQILYRDGSIHDLWPVWRRFKKQINAGN